MNRSLTLLLHPLVQKPPTFHYEEKRHNQCSMVRSTHDLSRESSQSQKKTTRLTSHASRLSRPDGAPGRIKKISVGSSTSTESESSTLRSRRGLDSCTRNSFIIENDAQEQAYTSIASRDSCHSVHSENDITSYHVGSYHKVSTVTLPEQLSSVTAASGSEGLAPPPEQAGQEPEEQAEEPLSLSPLAGVPFSSRRPNAEVPPSIRQGPGFARGTNLCNKASDPLPASSRIPISPRCKHNWLPTDVPPSALPSTSKPRWTSTGGQSPSSQIDIL